MCRLQGQDRGGASLVKLLQVLPPETAHLHPVRLPDMASVDAPPPQPPGHCLRIAAAGTAALGLVLLALAAAPGQATPAFQLLPTAARGSASVRRMPPPQSRRSLGSWSRASDTGAIPTQVAAVRPEGQGVEAHEAVGVQPANGLMRLLAVVCRWGARGPLDVVDLSCF